MHCMLSFTLKRFNQSQIFLMNELTNDIYPVPTDSLHVICEFGIRQKPAPVMQDCGANVLAVYSFSVLWFRLSLIYH